jgi:dTMP kinase
MPMRGLFISFEGTEGCGKSTQIELLQEKMESEGHRVLVVREPGGTALGEAVRELLLRPAREGAALTPQSELLLFAASRAQLVRERIGPALAEGVHVIADRFLDSTTVYQGFGRGLDLIAVSQINSLAIGPHIPEITFLLDLEAATGHARALERSGGQPDRMESEPMEFFERVRAGYLHVAREEKSRLTVLNAENPPATLAEAVWEKVSARLAHRH